MTDNKNNSYQVTARKWRPIEFASVLGQEHITQTLINAIISGRLHHAYLFNGPRGVGKTTTARILAKALNCLNPSENKEPCNKCDSCTQILEGRSMDVVEIDGASNNSVDDIRKLRENARYPPISGKFKLYIIDEVHMLSTSAFNALLKTLEEPPKHLIFIFATTEPHKLPATILSRCQRFDFKRMQINDIVSRLKFIAEKENIKIDDDSLIIIARKADGSMRDSQSIFDQVVAFCGLDIKFDKVNSALSIIDQGFYFRVTDMINSKSTSQAFEIVSDIIISGYDIQEFLIGLSEHFRNFLTVIINSNSKLIEAARSYIEKYESDSNLFQQGDIIRSLQLTLQAQQNIKFASQPRLRLELLLTQLATMDSVLKIEELISIITNSNSFEGIEDSLNVNSISKPNSVIEEKKKYSLVNKAIDSTQNGFKKELGNKEIVENFKKGITENLENNIKKKTDLTIDFLNTNWDLFLKTITEKPSIFNQITNLFPSEIVDKSVKIYVENQTSFSMLNRSLEYINIKFNKYFGNNYSLEFLLGKNPSIKDLGLIDSNLNNEINNPYLKGIIELLNATKVL
ncbi:MAG: DNA polymerase III subunit gamma/tau [Chlorobiota bacterium]|nr:MAG: DNA polymerase III subunit gamma/tau [Chlorobiota bacterium]